MLSIRDVSHAYGDVVSLRGASLDVASGEILCLLGPSGCGKTTLLRIIAGLESAHSGTLSFAGEDLQGIPAHRRNFGLMFQDYALFPHMNAADNIAYGLKRRGHAKGDVASQVVQLLERVGLPGIGTRDIASLSGGQKQRVALARSLAPKPRLLMLDEPLGSLDARMRDQLALELRQIIKAEGISAIYVTHDHREAYAIADRIAVMNIARIEQIDTPQNLYRQPRSVFAAKFLGFANIFDARRNRLIGALIARAKLDLASATTVLIHPSGLSLGSDACQGLRCQGILESAIFRGGYYDLCLSLDGETSLSFAWSSRPAEIGATLTVCIAREAFIALED